MQKRVIDVFFILIISCITTSYATEYHVSVKGNNNNDGSLKKPFRTISKAVEKAYPGDTITVHAGTYRERIDPLRGGESTTKRIVYRAAPGEEVKIKGSEIITDWKKVKNKKGVWKVVLPNTFFGTYNPYKDVIFGDWFIDMGRIHHTGEVFLNEQPFYEVETLDKVFYPPKNEKIADTEGSKHTWYCTSDDQTTTIWANFQESNPNKELVEISMRATCIYPKKPGIDYITIKGFHISQAATQWAAPTAEQVGMVATHWNKGWIIEDNVISNSKCSGITLGKDRSTGHNVWSKDSLSLNRDGNIHYIEVIFRTLRNGWNKENVGSHTVRNNEIFNCGQTGICGSMGAVFSTIENNHIHHIYTNRQYRGFEMAGIKFHAPIDVTIKNNRIHHTDRGIWLDWMTQGARVTRNLLYQNDLQDIFLEVNHGPFMVDNNILLSSQNIKNQSEGGAFVHNLFAGSIERIAEWNRFTPYHLPHSTEIKGLNVIRGGDNRYYNNLCIGNGEDSETDPLDSSDKKGQFPISVKGNVYLKESILYTDNKGDTEKLDFDPKIQLLENDGKVFLKLEVPNLPGNNTLITTELLGKTLVSKLPFENPDGTPMTIDIDFHGNKRMPGKNYPGPFSFIRSDLNFLRLGEN